MDGEFREAFREIRDTVTTGTARLDGKLDQANAQFNVHLVEDAKQFQKLHDAVSQIGKRQDGISDTIRLAKVAQEQKEREEAARRIEDLKERRGYKVAIWVALIGAGATVVLEILVHWIAKH